MQERQNFEGNISQFSYIVGVNKCDLAVTPKDKNRIIQLFIIWCQNFLSRSLCVFEWLKCAFFAAIVIEYLSCALFLFNYMK